MTDTAARRGTHAARPGMRRGETTLANWMEPEHTRWSFRHVRELIPTAPIAAGRSNPGHSDDGTTVRTPDAPEVRWTHGEEEVHLSDFLLESATDALVVMTDEGVQVEWYAAHQSADDLHIIFSVSKSVAGLLAGCLADQGVLRLDEVASTYVPEIGESGFAGATVRDLLDMTANTNFVEDYSVNGLMRAYRQAAGWMLGGKHSGLRTFIPTLQRGGAHTQRFQYTSVTTDLLGWVLERAGGAAYADLVSTHLWDPMGATSDANITVDPVGTARAAGGISATAVDMARIGLTLLDGHDVVPSDFVADIKTAGNLDHWARGDFPEYLPGGSYRSGWYVDAPGAGVCIAGGIHGQLIYVDTVRRVVVAKQSRLPAADNMAEDLAALEMARAIACRYGR